MSTYGRTGKPMDPQQNPPPEAPAQAQAIKINGYAQVFEMLKAADPAFRASLLNRISAADPRLAQNLRRELAAHGI